MPQCRNAVPFEEENRAKIIQAEVHTDDWRNSAPFDATPWFEQSSDGEILALAAIEWVGDYEADQVSQHVSGLPG